MNKNVILQEAFKQFDLLEEESFSLSNKESVEDAEEFMDAGTALDVLDVIDPEATTEEEVEDSYLNKVIIDCNVCHSKIYKDPEEIHISEDGECVNCDEECPFCFSTDGFKIIGQVAPFVEEPVYEVTVEPKDEDEADEEEVEEEDEVEVVEESLKNRGRRNRNRRAKLYKESLENIDLETEHDRIHIEAEEKEEDFDGEEMLAPVSDETEEEIADNQVEEEEETEEEVEEPAEDEVDVDIDEFDEETFDELGESYLKRVYENVNSFRTTAVKEKKNGWLIEGVIGFNSGSNKKTSFLFEAKDMNKKGKLRFIGENKQISRGKKSFTITGSVSGKKFFTESLNYNYRQKDQNGKSVRVYGTLKNKK